MELKIKALSPKIGTDIPLPRFATAGAGDVRPDFGGQTCTPASTSR